VLPVAADAVLSAGTVTETGAVGEATESARGGRFEVLYWLAETYF
jgi:hypothetical protein